MEVSRSCKFQSNLPSPFPPGCPRLPAAGPAAMPLYEQTAPRWERAVPPPPPCVRCRTSHHLPRNASRADAQHNAGFLGPRAPRLQVRWAPAQHGAAGRPRRLCHSPGAAARRAVPTARHVTARPARLRDRTPTSGGAARLVRQLRSPPGAGNARLYPRDPGTSAGRPHGAVPGPGTLRAAAAPSADPGHRAPAPRAAAICPLPARPSLWERPFPPHPPAKARGLPGRAGRWRAAKEGEGTPPALAAPESRSAAGSLSPQWYKPLPLKRLSAFARTGKHRLKQKHFIDVKAPVGETEQNTKPDRQNVAGICTSISRCGRSPRQDTGTGGLHVGPSRGCCGPPPAATVPIWQK